MEDSASFSYPGVISTVALCAPHIMAAQLEEAKATTWKDFLPLVQTAGMILGGGLLLGTGNPLLWGGAFMMYRNWKKSTEAAAPKP